MANPKFIEDPNMALRPAAGVPFDPKTLGDGEIIRATKQVTNEHGLTQFRMTMPSGREIESEWLREEQLKKALLPWIETIRAELQSDADEVRAMARRQSEERKAKAAPALVSPLGDVLSAEQPARAPKLASTMPSPTPTAAAASSGIIAAPSEFAKAGLKQAQEDAGYWQEQAQAAMLKWQEASDNVEKWERILAAIGAPKEETRVEQNSDTDLEHGSSLPVGIRRRGRPAGSKNRPKQPGADLQPAGEGKL